VSIKSGQVQTECIYDKTVNFFRSRSFKALFFTKYVANNVYYLYSQFRRDVFVLIDVGFFSVEFFLPF